MSRITQTTWSWRVDYKPKTQPAKDRNYQSCASQVPVGNEAEAKVACAAKIAELKRSGFKVVYEGVLAKHRSVGTDDRALVVGYREDGTILQSHVLMDETWDAVNKQVERTVHTGFLCREDMHYFNIFVIWPGDPGEVILAERRDYPAYMSIFHEIQALCREHLKPTQYHLTSREACRFSLSLYTGHGADRVFDAVLDTNVVNEVKRFLDDREEAQDREERTLAEQQSVAVLAASEEEEQRC